MRSGIRTQVTVTLTFVLGFGLLVSWLITARVTESAVVDGHIARARQAAALAAGRFSTVPPGGHALAESLEATRPLIAPDALFIVDRMPQPIFRGAWGRAALEALVDPLALAPLLQRGIAHRVLPGPGEGGAQLLAVVVPIEAHPERWVCLLSSLAPTTKRVATLEGMLLLFTLVTLGLAIIPGYVLLGRLVVRPVQRLVRHTERVRSGQYGRVEELAGASVELEELVDAFDRMTAKLGKDRQRIERQLAELRHANQEIATTQRQLVVTEKLATVGTLAAGVAHEIGNPIAVLQGYVEMLGDAGLDEASRATMLSAMEDAVGRISTIIRDLLDFARPVDESDTVCDAVQAVEASVKLVQPQKRFKGLDLEVTLPTEAAPAACNSGRLEQVLLNLLFNAADASAEDGAVRVAVTVDERDVRISVRDEGTGIPDETLIRIFDPFYTTKDPGEGTGLGLAICHNIITSAGGSLDVDSAVGEGSTFTVVLPRA